MKLIPYESRLQAGELLAKFVLNQNPALKHNISEKIEEVFLFAIPNGGVPVAEGFCKVIGNKYDILIVRKIKIPYNTEAGFGSVTTDGTVLINEALLSQLNLSENSINNSIEITKKEIRERINLYNKSFDVESTYNTLINNHIIFLVDDGLASGFTMLAAIKMIKKYTPKKLYVAVPTAPEHTVIRIQHEIDEIYCPNIKKTSWFAVAEAYKHWYDLSESEVIDLMKNSKFLIKS